jgi:hypothetical protein
VTLRIFGRCIQLNKRSYPLLQGFLSGGQRTAWPWWEVRVGRFELSVSRIRPRKAVQ